MKAIAFVWAALFALALSALADDFKLTDGREYKGVTVSRAEPDGLVVVTDSGIEKIPFTLLPKEIQKQYGYDAQKAAAYQQSLQQARSAAVASESQKIAAQKQADAEVWKQNQSEMDATKKAQKEAQSSYVNPLEQSAVTKISVAGTVSQVIKEGLIIECDETSSSIGYKKATGSVLLKGYGKPKIAEGDTVKSVALEDGTFTYITVLGASRTVHAYTCQ